MSVTALKPLALNAKQAAKIGIVALGSPLNPERMRAGMQFLEKRGYDVLAPLDPCQYYGRYDYGFTNGSPQMRAAALHQLIEEPEVGAVIAARGGYGVLELLPYLDLEKISRARKAIVGNSDVTALLAQSGSALSIPLVHGPTIGDAFADAASSAEANASVESLFRLLTEPNYRYSVKCQVLRDGQAQGIVLAGNLSMLVALLGTPWDVDYTGRILVIEEVGEAPYRIHRLLTQLKMAGKLARLSGLVLGRFSKCDAHQGPSTADVLQMLLRDMLADTSFPVISALPFGHWGENQALALGRKAAIVGNEFSVLESPLE